MRSRLVLLLVAAACQDTIGLPPAGEEFAAFPPGAKADEVVKAIDGERDTEGLRTPGHGVYYFVVLRDGDRHGPAYRQAAFHAVIGAGVTLPEGALLVRRVWAVSGQVDGTNEQPERLGISVVVEPGAAKPYSGAIVAAAATIVEALGTRLPLHPDCVLAMGEIAYTNEHPSDRAERELAKAARERVPVPAPDGHVVVRSGGREIKVAVEHRPTAEGIAVGMMFRNRFDGENRGMLFEYPNPDYRHFWMRNCRIPIDVAFIHGSRIEEIRAMEPAFGLPRENPLYYDSSAVANLALEMPAGWFEENGVKAGDTVTVDIPKKPAPPRAGR